MEKIKQSSRFFTDLLIVLFGIVILTIVILINYQGWFSLADTQPNVYIGDGHDPQLNFTYPLRVFSRPAGELYTRGFQVVDPPQGTSVKFLEVYDQAEINSVMGSNTRDYPAYKVPYSIVVSAEEPAQTGIMVVVPLPSYNYNYGRYARNDSATDKLLNWAKARSLQTNLGNERSALAEAVTKYDQAILAGTATFRIDATNKLVLTTDTSILNSCPGAPQDCDPNVRAAATGGGTDQDPFDAFSVSIDTATHYINPNSQSLALRILRSTSSEAARVNDTAAKELIDAALSNYNRQIASASTSNGLSITSVNTIRFEETQTVRFSASLSDLNIGSGGSLRKLMFNIDQNTQCTIDYNGDSSSLASGSSSKCSWTRDSNSGSFTWDTTTANDLGTQNPGTRTLMLKAFSTADVNNDFGRVSKTVTVQPGTGEYTTPGGGSVPMSVTVPQSVDKSNAEATRRVQIKISASNLNPGGYAENAVPPRVGKIAWYICAGTQQTITNNDSTGCSEKEKFGPFGTETAPQNSFTNKAVEWDASGSAPGTYVVMLKAFGMPTAPNVYPYIEGTKVVSSNITVVENLSDGGGDGGPTDEASNPIDTPNWIVGNYQQSKLTVQQLIGRVGTFTLLVLGALAIIAIIMAGLKYITSGGDEKKAEAGKKALLFSVYGIIIATLSIFLVQITVNEVNNLIAPFPAPDSRELKVPFGRTGPTAEIIDIIGQTDGIAWKVIKLAVLYSEAVAIFFILYASFLYMSSFGDESKAENGKKTMIWALIGLAIVLAANIILRVLTGIII